MSFVRRLKFGTGSVIFLIVYIAVLVMINLLSQQYFSRLDLTAEKEFSVTQATRDILTSLDDIVNIEVYFSGNLPPYTTPLVRRVRDILDEYRAFSGDKLRISYLDPKADEELAEKAESLGVPEIQMNIIQKDQAQVANVYMGLVTFYEDRTAVIPVLTDIGNLEYELTTAIRAVMSEEISTIGFLDGNDEKSIDDDYLRIRRFLEKRFRVWPVSVMHGSPMPKKVNLLVVAGTKGITERQKFEIDQFIMRGGKVMFLIDSVEIDKNMKIQDRESNLNDMLEHYGARVKRDLVVDLTCGMASFSSGYVTYSLKYPFWPEINRDGFSEDHPATQRLENLVLPWVSSLEVETEKLTGITVEKIVHSSPASWTVRTEKVNLAPQQKWNPPEEGLEQQSLIVVVSGKLTSFYAGKDVPPVDDKKEDGDEDAEDQKDKEVEYYQEVLTEMQPDTQGRIMVMGDSDFLTDGFVERYPNNAVFFLNMVDWISLNEDLIAIRSKGLKNRPIDKDLTDRSKLMAKAVGIFLMPMFLWVIGIISYFLRRRDQAAV